LERRGESREAAAASRGEGPSAGDARSGDGGGEAGEAGEAGDVEDWARLSSGALLVLLPSTYSLSLRTACYSLTTLLRTITTYSAPLPPTLLRTMTPYYAPLPPTLLRTTQVRCSSSCPAPPRSKRCARRCSLGRRWPMVCSGSGYCLCTARCRPTSKGVSSTGRRRAVARPRSCSRPTWPRPRSLSTMCASPSTPFT
jgi:hypothetical protein